MGEEDFQIMSAAARDIMKTHEPEQPGAVPGTSQTQGSGDPGQPDPQPARCHTGRRQWRTPAGREAKYLEYNPLQ